MKLLTLWKVMKFLGPAMLVAGCLLLYFGYKARESAGSKVEEFFTGTPSDNALLFLIGGGVLVALGLGATFKGFKGVKS